MAVFHSARQGIDFTSAEDSMEVYPEGETHPEDEDGIDIDFDLTADHSENLDDDEMLEDPEADVDDMAPDTELVQDEQMIDDEGGDDDLVQGAAGDVYSEHYVELEDVGATELQDKPEVVVDTAKQQPHLAEEIIVDNASQDTRQQDTQDLLDGQSSFDQRSDAHFSHSNISSNADKSRTEDIPVAEAFSKAVSARSIGTSPTSGDNQNTISRQLRDIHSPSRGLTTALNEPRTTVREQQTELGLDQSATLKKVSGVFKGNEGRAEITAEALVEDARHDLDLLENRTSLRDSFATTAESKGYSNSEPLPGTQDHAIPHLFEENADEPVAPKTDHPQGEKTVQNTLHVHPVTVHYQSNEMYLFRPTEEQREHENYMLSDNGLAAEGIEDLFGGLRNFLGDSISDAEELEITFDGLDLQICESSVDVANVALIQILDIIRQLRYNDDEEEFPESISLTLSTKVRFTGRLKYLEDLVIEGVGLSRLVREKSLLENGSLEYQHAPGTIAEPEHLVVDTNLDEANESTADTKHNPPEHSAKDTLTEFPAGEFTKVSHLSTDSAERLTMKGSVASAITDSGDATNPKGNGKPLNYVDPSSARDPSNDPTQFHNENSTNTQIPQRTDGVNEGFEEEEYDGEYEEEYEEEEGFGIEEDAYPDEGSAGSSTIQGDDAMVSKDDVDISNQAGAFDVPLTITQQQLLSPSKENPEAEDVISYESDEDNEGDTEDNKYNSEWRSDEVDFTTTETNGAKSTALRDTDGTSSNDLIHNNDGEFSALDNHDLGAAEGNSDDSDPDRFGRDQNSRLNEQDMEKKDEQVGDNVAFENSDEASHSSNNSAPTPNQVIEKGNNNMQTSTTIDGAEAEPRGLPRQISAPSVEDEDEITFDDDIEDEAIIEDLAGAPTDPPIQQTARSSPGALKRTREDETMDRDSDQGE
ncbi:MAG: hypothetical protein Q9166_002342 [cf. Caloplaca sp. 2 TL-2023]